MIQWMQSYNQQKENKIQFMGFDMQIPWGVLHNLEGFAKESKDSQLEDWLKQVSTMQQKVEQTATSSQATKRDLLRISEQVEKKISASEASPFIRRNAQALVQLAKMQQLTGKAANNFRDEAMAESVESILGYTPGAKVVLWAHNGHVNKTGGMFKTMGYYLSQKYGTNYVSVGFATGTGSFAASNQAGIFTRNNQLIGPVENSFENWLSKAREENFLLNLKATSMEQEGSKWLYEKKMFRNIGWRVAVRPEYQFIPQNSLPYLYDAIIYLDKTTSANAYLAKE
jgi:erythromycin esterase